MKKYVGLSIFTALILANCAGNQARVYIIEMFVGNVTVSTNGGSDWMAAEPGMSVTENDRIRTRGDSYCELTMPQRGTLRISYDSDITLKELHEGTETIAVPEGTVAVSVDNKLKNGETFRVETGTAVAAIRGTRFLVNTTASGSETIVREGVVQVQPNIDLGFIGDEDIRGIIESYIQIEVRERQGLSVSPRQAESLREIIRKSWEAGVTIEQMKEIILDALKRLGLQASYLNEANVRTLYSSLMGSSGDASASQARAARESEPASVAADTPGTSSDTARVGEVNYDTFRSRSESLISIAGEDTNAAAEAEAGATTTTLRQTDDTTTTLSRGGSTSTTLRQTGVQAATTTTVRGGSTATTLRQTAGTTTTLSRGGSTTTTLRQAASPSTTTTTVSRQTSTTTTTTVRQTTASTTTTTTVRGGASSTTTTTVGRSGGGSVSSTTTTTIDLDDLESLGLNIRE